LLEEGVEHYYEIFPGRKEEYLASFQDSLNRYYPIGYTTEIDTEVMCLLAQRITNAEKLNEKEKKFYSFWKYIDCSKIPTKTFKSSYDKSIIKISPEGVKVQFQPNNRDPVYGDDCLDSLFFYGPEIPAVSLEDRVQLQKIILNAIHDKAELSEKDAFPLFDFSKLISFHKEFSSVEDRSGESIQLSQRGLILLSSWDRWDGGSTALSLEKAWRDKEKNLKEGIFKEAYIEIYKIMKESIIIL
jgi:hypothetical protein